MKGVLRVHKQRWLRQKKELESKMLFRRVLELPTEEEDPVMKMVETMKFKMSDISNVRVVCLMLERGVTDIKFKLKQKLCRNTGFV